MGFGTFIRCANGYRPLCDELNQADWEAVGRVAEVDTMHADPEPVKTTQDCGQSPGGNPRDIHDCQSADPADCTAVLHHIVCG